MGSRGLTTCQLPIQMRQRRIAVSGARLQGVQRLGGAVAQLSQPADVGVGGRIGTGAQSSRRRSLAQQYLNGPACCACSARLTFVAKTARTVLRMAWQNGNLQQGTQIMKAARSSRPRHVPEQCYDGCWKHCVDQHLQQSPLEGARAGHASRASPAPPRRLAAIRTVPGPPPRPQRRNRAFAVFGSAARRWLRPCCHGVQYPCPHWRLRVQAAEKLTQSCCRPGERRGRLRSSSAAGLT